MFVIFEIIALVVTAVLAILWIRDPSGNYEPWTILCALVGVIAEIYRRFKHKTPNNSVSRSHDQALFHEFQQILPAEPTLRLFKEHDFGNSFRKQAIGPLYDFVATWDTVEKEFLNKEVESKKKSLYSAAEDLAMEFARRTVPIGAGDFASVFSDNQRNSGHPRPPSVIEDARVLNEKTTEFVPKYEDFVRTSRSKLL